MASTSLRFARLSILQLAAGRTAPPATAARAPPLLPLPRRKLVVLPAAQARRGRRSRGPARRDLLLRGRARRRRLPACLRLARCVPGGAYGRCGRDPARLPRAVDGRTGL